MSKVMFVPVSAVSGLLAGVIGKKLFATIWGLIDDQEAPQPEHRDISLGKLVLALILEGALFSLVRGLVSHGSRQAFSRLTGSWPGEEEPESE